MKPTHLLKLLLLTLAFSSVFAKKPIRQHNPEELTKLSQNLLVLSKPNDWRWLAQLGDKAELLNYYKDLSVIRLIPKNTPEIRKEILALPGVVAIQRDYPVFPLEKHTDEVETQDWTTLEVPSNADRTAIAAPTAGCALEDKCNKNIPKYWAYNAVDADLMQLKMMSLGVTDLQSANVAVVDSGFDKAQIKNYSVVGTVHTFPAADFKQKHPITGKELPGTKPEYFLGDPNKDESGHGTMVASVIAGAGKLGVAKNVSLSVYRVTKPGSTGSTSSAILETAMYKACEDNKDPDGLTVINVSWGGRLDESGLQPEEQDDVTKKLLEKFSDMGCIIIKAAGNDNFRQERKFDLDDPYLRAASIDSSRNLSYFSTIGEVSAPGSSMYVLESTTASNRASQEKRCDESDARTPSPKRLVNGTSFAAPLTAAIASQVIRVLKLKDSFKKLSPPQRISLVNRILAASTSQNSINGLRAVALAGYWNQLAEEEQSEALRKEGVSFLSNLFERESETICAKQAERCFGKTECEKIKSCMVISRAKLLLCPKNSEIFLADDLAKTFYKYGAFSSGYRYSQIAVAGLDDEQKKSQLRYITMKSLKESVGLPSTPTIEESYWKYPPDVDPNLIKEIILPYMIQYADQLKAPSSSAYTKNYFKLAFYSSSIIRSLEYGVDPNTKEDRGSNETQETVKELLKQARKILSPQKYVEFIDEYVSWFNARLDRYNETREEYKYSEDIFPVSLSVAAVRTLSAAIDNEPGDSPILPKLLQTEKRILNKMAELNQFHGRETVAISLLGETYPTRSTLEPMLKRQNGMLLDAYSSNTLHLLAPAQVQYAVDHVDSISEITNKTDFLLSVLNSMGLKGGWGKSNDGDLLDATLLKLMDLWPSLSETEQKRLQEKFHKMVEDAENVHLVSGMLTSWIEDKVFLKDRLGILFGFVNDKQEREKGHSYKKHPLFNSTITNLLSTKMSAFIMSLKPGDLESIKYNTGIRTSSAYSVRGIWSKELPQNSRIVTPLPPELGVTRLKKKPVPTSERTMTDRDQYFSEFIESFAAKLNDPKTRTFYADIEYSLVPGPYEIKYDKTSRETFASIPLDGKWRKTAEVLKKASDPRFSHFIDTLILRIEEAKKPLN